MKELSNRRLLHLIAQNHRNEQAWGEFLERFHQHICRAIYRACIKTNYRKGFRKIEDIAQDVYLRLLENDGARLKNFTGKWNGSIYKFLEIVAIRMTYNHLVYSLAKKRIPASKMKSIETKVCNSWDDGQLELRDLLGEDDWQFVIFEFEEAIDQIIDGFTMELAKNERAKHIFKQYYFRGLSPREISQLPEFDIKPKTVSNIASELAKTVERRLRNLMLDS